MVADAALLIGTAVAKVACGLWVGDSTLVGDSLGSVIEAGMGRLPGLKERLRYRRLWEETAERIAARIEPMLKREFEGIPENEFGVTVDLVRRTFEESGLTDEEIFARDLDAARLESYLYEQQPHLLADERLSEKADGLYRLLVRDGCASAIQVARNMPRGAGPVLLAMLQRQTEILAQVSRALDRLPVRRSVEDFEADYRQLIGNQLNQIEFIGAPVSEAAARYELSIAYLNLNVIPRSTPSRGAAASDQARPLTRVEDMLAHADRVFIRGHAGLGKTTLLSWVAVQAARRAFEGDLRGWNGMVPFYVPLRRYVEGDLPAPEQFISEIGRTIATEMPAGWVHDQLRGGNALVLVDGVDELPKQRRAAARTWLSGLIDMFPAARYLVTSRPVTSPEWLAPFDFAVADLQAMTGSDVTLFVHRWHEALRSKYSEDDPERDRLTRYEQHLLQEVEARAHLRSLAGYPLLCALLCALNRDMGANLPKDRIELYDDALRLFHRRDTEREIANPAPLDWRDKQLILQDVAYWMVRNGHTDAATDLVVGRIEAKLAGMHHVTYPPEAVFRALVERSGLLRETEAGRVDFVHRSFQEHLAARAAVDAQDIGLLVANAYDHLWREVVVVAAGMALPGARDELLQGLLGYQRPGAGREERDTVTLLALACLETAREVDPALLDQIRGAASALLPPTTEETARTVARAGAFALGLLTAPAEVGVAEAVGTIRAATLTMEPTALPIIARFATDDRPEVVEALIAGWPVFATAEYAEAVLRDSPLLDGYLRISEPLLIPGLRHLRRLRELECDTRAPVDLSFVQRLTSLESLAVSPVESLAGLAGTGLLALRAVPRRLVSLMPLAEVPRLRSLEVEGIPTDLQTLRTLPDLEHLALRGLSVAALGVLQPLTGLRSLRLTDTPVADLAPLGFLREPRRLVLRDSPAVTDLSAIGQWAASLSELMLDGAFDGVEALAELAALRELALGGSVRPGTALARLPSLTRLSVAGHLDFGATPLPESLTDLELMASQVNLGGLRAARPLRVWVAQNAVVGGTDGLPSHVEVVRVDPLAALGLQTLLLRRPRRLPR